MNSLRNTLLQGETTRPARPASRMHPDVVRAIRTGMQTPAQAQDMAGVPNRADPDAPVAATEGEPECANCGNKRFLVGADGKLKPCNACGVAAERAVASMDAYSSANGRAKEQFFSNFQVDWEGYLNATLMEAKIQAEAFARTPAGFLVLWGERGHGKSHLCAAIYNALRARKRVAIFVKMSRLADSIKRLYTDETAQAEGTSASQRLDVYCQAPVLLIDDIGADNYTPHDDGILSTIVDYRYANQLPTVFVSNWDVREVDGQGNPNNRFDPRIVSRWNDVDFSVVLNTAAADYRQRARL